MKTSFELNRILSPVYCWIDSTELDKAASISLPENKKKEFSYLVLVSPQCHFQTFSNTLARKVLRLFISLYSEK